MEECDWAQHRGKYCINCCIHCWGISWSKTRRLGRACCGPQWKDGKRAISFRVLKARRQGHKSLVLYPSIPQAWWSTLVPVSIWKQVVWDHWRVCLSDSCFKYVLHILCDRSAVQIAWMTATHRGEWVQGKARHRHLHFWWVPGIGGNRGSLPSFTWDVWGLILWEFQLLTGEEWVSFIPLQLN